MKTAIRNLRQRVIFRAERGDYAVMGYTLGDWRVTDHPPASYQAWESKVISTLVLEYKTTKPNSILQTRRPPFVIDFWVPEKHADEMIDVEECS